MTVGGEGGLLYESYNEIKWSLFSHLLKYLEFKMLLPGIFYEIELFPYKLIIYNHNYQNDIVL